MLILFIVCSFINVILNTLKSILTVKAGKHTAAMINAITFGFYTIVVKQLTSFPLMISVPVTMAMNLAGVYASMWILDKFKKDKVWKITVVGSAVTIQNINFDFVHAPAMEEAQVICRGGVLEIYSYTQKQSRAVSDIISAYDVQSYFQEVNKFQ